MPQKGVLKNRILAFGLEAIVAKVYKAPSWLDNKECIVLDYSETSLVAHYVRDEIRLIGPGFYLGKVYWGKDRLIDFCLQVLSHDAAGPLHGGRAGRGRQGAGPARAAGTR